MGLCKRHGLVYGEVLVTAKGKFGTPLMRARHPLESSHQEWAKEGRVLHRFLHEFANYTFFTIASPDPKAKWSRMRSGHQHQQNSITTTTTSMHGIFKLDTDEVSEAGT